MKRIEEFLLKKEKHKMIKRRCSKILHEVEENFIELNDVSAIWDDNSNSETLSKINLKVKSGVLCAVIGSVGSGKVKSNMYIVHVSLIFDKFF